jgi:hypothetical protein
MMIILLIATIPMAPVTAQEVDRAILFHQLDIADLCSDRSGNLYMLAEFHGDAEVGDATYTSRGASDLLIVHLRSDGSAGWVRQIEGPNNEMAGGIAVDSAGNVVVAGSFESTVSIGGTTLSGRCADIDRTLEQSCEDIFVARYAPDGSMLWARSEGGWYGDRATSVAAGEDGSIYVTGFVQDSAWFAGGSLLKGGPHDLFIACYDSSGAISWLRRAVGSGISSGSRIALRSKRLWVAGSFSGTVTIDGVPASSAGASDGLLIGANVAGTIAWMKGIGGNGMASLAGVAGGADNSVHVAGSFTGTIVIGDTMLQSAGAGDMMIASFDSIGALRWIRSAGGVGEEKAGGIAIGERGDIIIAGSFSASSRFGKISLSSIGASDIVVARYSLNGTLVNAMSIGGSGVDIGRSIASGSSRGIFLAGTIQNNVRMGSIMQSAGNGASYVAWLVERSSGIDGSSRDGRDGMIVPNGDRPDLSSTSGDSSRPVAP